MSIDVALAELAAVVGRRGPLAYLVTVGDGGPRVVSVTVEMSGDGSLVMEAGRHSVANALTQPAVTLLWPPDDADPNHTLLVDGVAEATAPPSSEPSSEPSPEPSRASRGGGSIRVVPTSAILHRIRVGKGGSAGSTGSG